MKYLGLIFIILLIESCTNRRSRTETFPFDNSDTIMLVSYNTRRAGLSNDKLIVDGKFIVPDIMQRVTLSQRETDRLFSILYDSDKVGGHNLGPGADCYNPRHSVVFYNHGQAIAFLEVCFECEGTKQTAGVDFGGFTRDKWCTLQKFFEANKADFGIEPEMCP